MVPEEEYTSGLRFCFEKVRGDTNDDIFCRLQPRSTRGWWMGRLLS
jgi:hypothetical protein